MRHLQITSMHLQDNFNASTDNFNASFGHLQDVLLVLVRHLVDVFLPTGSAKKQKLKGKV